MHYPSSLREKQMSDSQAVFRFRDIHAYVSSLLYMYSHRL